MTQARLDATERSFDAALVASAAALLVAHHYVAHALDGDHPGALHFFLSVVASWAPWLVLVPAILEVARRFPLRGAPARNVVVLAAAGIPFSLAAGTLELSLRLAAPEEAALVPAVSGAAFLARGLALDLLFYAGIIATHAAVHERVDTEPPAERFQVDDGRRIRFVNREDIDWIEAAGNYVVLHVGPESHVYRSSLRAMDRRLDGGSFVRIHRSRIVNVDRVSEMAHWSSGDYRLTLRDGTVLRLSRKYRRNLDRRTGRS